MASRIKVDEVTNLAQSGSVSFPTGGASFSGNVAVTGNIDFTGQLLQNGSPFVTLPTQTADNLGYVLRSGGTSGTAFWDGSGEGSQVGGCSNISSECVSGKKVFELIILDCWHLN